MRSLLSTERLEDVEGRLAVTDVDSNGNRFVVKFWVDETPTSPREELTTPLGDENLSSRVPHAYSAVPPFPSLTMEAENGRRHRQRKGKDHLKTTLVKVEALALEALNLVVERMLMKQI